MAILSVVGRILFALPLIMMAMNHFTNMKMMVGFAESKGVPMANVAVPLSAAILIVGVVGLVFDFYSLYSGILVALFMIPVAFKMHDFWTIEDF